MTRGRALRCASLLLIVGLLASLPVLAQKITGDISGTVQDTTGAVVKEAKVAATNYATGETGSRHHIGQRFLSDPRTAARKVQHDGHRARLQDIHS